MTLSHYLWLLPFLCFALGYQLLNSMLSVPEYDAPKVIGLSLVQAAQVAEEHNLMFRITGYREEVDLEEGTVLEQTPAAHHGIKQNQPIFLTLSRKPPKKITPNFQTKQKKIIDDYCKRHGLRPKYYPLKGHHPQNTCIGQSPEPGMLLDAHTVDVYISDGSHALCLFPDFKNIPLSEVKELLGNYQAQLTIVHRKEPRANHVCRSCLVLDQKPLPGSLVDLTQPLSVQLQVDS
ncbi:PASTA domain-containing protein [Candidatus Babeliales bacterium]|nr:PASTA domain-containing protein [Candidatus Babeliales bacterium]